MPSCPLSTHLPTANGKPHHSRPGACFFTSGRLFLTRDPGHGPLVLVLGMVQYGSSHTCTVLCPLPLAQSGLVLGSRGYCTATAALVTIKWKEEIVSILQHNNTVQIYYIYIYIYPVIIQVTYIPDTCAVGYCRT
jgi:hypothetical protein